MPPKRPDLIDMVALYHLNRLDHVYKLDRFDNVPDFVILGDDWFAFQDLEFENECVLLVNYDEECKEKYFIYLEN